MSSSLGKSQRPKRKPGGDVSPPKGRPARTPGLISVKKPSSAKGKHGGMEDPKIVVGIDFGTTCSGFAFTSKADPKEEVFAFYNWPCLSEAGEKLYCKTQTSLRYMPVTTTVGSRRLELKDWGWTAFVNYKQDLQSWNAELKDNPSSSSGRGEGGLEESCGHFLTNFKLCLGSDEPKMDLPEGFTAEQVISDYLRQFSIFIMEDLARRVGKHIVKRDVRWCLTLPTSWTDAAKQSMIDCAEMAGLVRGRFCQSEDASRHRIVLVLEPEAASVYCQQQLKDIYDFRKGSKFLVVDAGGGTVDLVVHEKIDDVSLKSKEVTYVKSGVEGSDLCGGTFVDSAFMKFLGEKIECFEQFSKDCPATVLAVKTNWEGIKCSFDGNRSYYMELPGRLATAWSDYEKDNGTWTKDGCYNVLQVTTEDMKAIFDGPVTKILTLIEQQVYHVPGIEAVVVVGGFSNSRYLMKRIQERFSSKVKHILTPTDPGSAVCRGAVAIGALGRDIMVSRKSRKTYGMEIFRNFREGDPVSCLVSDENGSKLCKDAFGVFTRTGDEIPVDHFVSHELISFNKGDKSIIFTLYTSSDSHPKFVTDKGVVKVGQWTYRIPLKAQTMKDRAAVIVTMYFGRTHVEVSAEPKNFGGGKASMFSVLFEGEPSTD